VLIQQSHYQMARHLCRLCNGWLNGDIDLTEELLSRSANPNISDTEGQSPLHQVVYTRDCLMASPLIKHAAHTLMVGTEGHSAI
jgi:ankyrin repeat protein